MATVFANIMKKLVAKWDPRLEKYRPTQPPYRPKTQTELIELLARTPNSVLSSAERSTIAAVMSFRSAPVRSVMIPRDQITFVYENDFLGPLMLNKLYQAGFEHFPVLGASGRITGLLHTSELNALRIQEADRALKYLDENVYYIRDDHTLEMALAAFLRTNSYFFIVIDRTEKVVGLITYEMVNERLLGSKVTDNFDRDLDPHTVARREITKN